MAGQRLQRKRIEAVGFGDAGAAAAVVEEEILEVAGFSGAFLFLQIRFAVGISRRRAWADLLRVSGRSVFSHQGEDLRIENSG